jgi:hypothetical protein
MTITPTGPGGELDSFAPGVIDKYSAPELDQITAVRRKDLSLKKAEQDWRFEVVRLKLMLDKQDAAEGLVATGQGGQQPSRFWDGARAGDFGSRLQGMADNGNRMTVNRWLQANDAAAKLLGSCVTAVTHGLPLQVAAERGIGPSTLEIYGSLSDNAREVADFYYEKRGELKADMLKEFRQVCEGYEERKPELLQGLADGSLKYPSHIQELMVEWEAQRREQVAAQKALDAAAALQKAEDNEAEAESYTPEVEPDTHVGDQPVDVAVRRSPSKSWFASSVGKQKVQEVVGTLSEPLPDLINGLSGLSKALDDQNRHASVMHNYAEFWAGYDRFFYTESTHRAKWGRAGRLERMRKLRSVLREVASKLDVYISVTTPPADIQYPEN